MAGLGIAAPAQALYGQADAAPGDFPYYSALIENGAPACGGAMIDSEWLLTASHCVSYLPIGSDVQIGWTSDNGGSPISTKVLEIVKAPSAPRPDLALVRVEPREGVKTIKLSAEPLPIGGTYLSVAAGDGSNGRLGSAQFTVTKQEATKQTGASKVAANCWGDSGSPAIVKTPAGDRLIGVTYGGDTCYLGRDAWVAPLSTAATWDWIHSVVPALNTETLSVPSSESQVRSGITVSQGDVIALDSTGSIRYGEDYSEYYKRNATLDVLPNGSKLDGDIPIPDVKYDESAISPTTPVGALLYKIGNGAWHAAAPYPHVISDESAANSGFTAEASGELVFAVNDADGYRYDNTGAFSTQVTVKK